MSVGDVSLSFTIPARLIPFLYVTEGPTGAQPDDAAGRLRQSPPGTLKPATAGARPEDSAGGLPSATTGRVT